MGPSGMNTLLTLTNVPSSSHCKNGGIMIQAGIDSNYDGILNENEVSSTAYVCNGVDGKNSLTKWTSELSGVNCENGGLKVDSGIDSNGNGVLESDEITATAYICNGVDGNNSLTKVTSEMNGNNCESGGLKIESGNDSNKNGLLDDEEISALAFVCNGVDGNASLVNVVDESPGADCPNGGVRIYSGIDTNRNGTLDASEILITRFVCNGIDGIINEQIQLKIVDGIGTAANTTSAQPVTVPGIHSFDIRNYPNVDSVVFVTDPWVANKNNVAVVELYNITDNQPIGHSMLSTNNLHGEKRPLFSANIFNELPKRPITLGIRLNSKVNGQFSASGIPYLFLYRSE